MSYLHSMKSYVLISVFSLFSICSIYAQITLEANGPGDTYELINSVLAPEHNVVETPDCGHGAFGRHIDEVFNAELDKHVFRFIMHTSEDDDRCINFDRQRNEIKTYDKSPDNLLGIRNEKIEYKWKFKLDSGFQPSTSFTHLHQLKAVGGPHDAMPLITITARKASVNRVELRFAEELSQSTIYQADLAPMLGVWLEATETVLYEEDNLGEYTIDIQRVDNGASVFSYSNDAIQMWKADADFIRPKWGIYRSLNDVGSLRDEQVLYADFSIHELETSALTFIDDVEFDIIPNPTVNVIRIPGHALDYFNTIHIYNTDGRLMLVSRLQSNTISVDQLSDGLYFVHLSSSEGRTRSKRIVISR